MRYEEWDFPERPPTRRRRKYYVEYQPSGWSSPIVRKVVNVYWAVTITAVKMLVAVPLSIMLIGSIWLIWVLITL
jgi:hypothetical protein